MAPHMKDPTCGKLLDHPDIKTAFGVYEYAGNKVVFCSKDCHDKFAENPGPHYANFIMWQHENFRDPVCAKEMVYDEAHKAFPVGYSFPNNGFGISKHKDHVFFFHGEDCKKNFDANPDKYHADWQTWREAKVKEVDGRVQSEGKHELKHLPDFNPEATQA